jgi:hypothetical protein
MQQLPPLGYLIRGKRKILFRKEEAAIKDSIKKEKGKDKRFAENKEMQKGIVLPQNFLEMEESF